MKTVFVLPLPIEVQLLIFQFEHRARFRPVLERLHLLPVLLSSSSMGRMAIIMRFGKFLFIRIEPTQH